MNAFGPQAPYYIFRNSTLGCRLLNQGDVKFLHKWLNDPELLKFYEGRDKPSTLEQIEEKYIHPRKQITRCIIEYEEKAIGYFQFYPLPEEQKILYGYQSDQFVYGIDLFLGETEFWGKGIGSSVIKEILAYLKEFDIHLVVADPLANNLRALKCYEKCGFKKAKLLKNYTTHESELQDCWLMEYKA